MALTAIATIQTKRKIFSLLKMKKPYEVLASPNRNNISFVVQKMENGCNLIDHFQCIVSEIKMKGRHSMCTIIYCQTILQCSLLYKLFASKLGNDMYLSGDGKRKERLIEMMHSQTAPNVKDHVLLHSARRMDI